MNLHRAALSAGCAACFALACGDAEVVEGPPIRPVVVTPVSTRDYEERIESSGQLLAKQRAEVAAQVAGEVTEVLADEGDAVEEDAIVIRIDPERRQLDLAGARARVGEAKASLAEAKREVDRMKELAGRQIASATKLDTAQTALELAQSRLSAARAQLGSAERALRDSNVRARFAGFVARRHVSRGEFVAEGQKLFELISLDPIEVEFHLPEMDSGRVKKGIAIEVTVAPFPDEVFDATVHMVSPKIDSRTRTLRVKGLIQNSDGRLRPGLFARANLGVATRTGAITVPEEAVLRRADGAIVFRVLADSRVERLPVKTGLIRDGWVEIVQGLEPDDSVVSRGHADLIDGSLVSARNPDGTAAVSHAGEVAGGESSAGALP
jgi:membrane fusion protein (multidrug efflux system)